MNKIISSDHYNNDSLRHHTTLGRLTYKCTVIGLFYLIQENCSIVITIPNLLNFLRVVALLSFKY